jgi:APA family basic amino acid/polyamine antiporter
MTPQNATLDDRMTEPKPVGSGLIRSLGTLDASMIVIGSMIGSGIFITSAESARLVGSPGWLLVAWALAGLMSITGALCAAEVAAMMPRAGGQYVFLREAYSPMFGFLFGWAMFLVVQTGTIAAVAIAFAKFLEVFVPQVSATNYLIAPIHLGPYAVSVSTQQLTGVLLIAFLTFVNTRGLALGKWVQNTFTVTKTAALIGLIVIGLLGINQQSAAWTSSWFNPWSNGWQPTAASPDLAVDGVTALLLLLGLAMIGPLFSQSAWNNVTFTGGEVRDPGRTLPRALILGVGGVVLLYVLANLIYVLVLPLGSAGGIQNAPSDRVGTAVMKAVLGPGGAAIMAGAILISTFGCVNGLVLAGARVYYAMARDGLFFERIGTTNRAHVPGAALVAQGIWSAVLTLPVTVTYAPGSTVPKYGNLYGELLEYVIPVDVTFYMLMVGAVIAFRWKAPNLERPYRMLAYPIPAVIYITMAVLLVLDFMYLKPKTSGFGYLIVLAGFPVYLIWSRRAATLRTAGQLATPAPAPAPLSDSP